MPLFLQLIAFWGQTLKKNFETCFLSQKVKAEEMRLKKKAGQPDIYKIPAPSRLKPTYTSSGSSQATAKPSAVQQNCKSSLQ